MRLNQAVGLLVAGSIVACSNGAPQLTIAVTISPTTVTVVAGASQSFTAAVTGTTDTAVTWSIEEGPSGGVVTQDGVYTAPAADGTFHVVATSAADPSRSATAAVTVSTPESAAPTGVTATPGDSEVTVSWTVSPGAVSYNLYYSSSASVTTATGTELAGATSGVSVTGLTDGTTYYFIVTAVNAGGESPSSSPVSATPEPAVPSAPSGVMAVAGDGQVTISWSGVASATSYNLYYSTQESGVQSGTEQTGVDSGVVVTGLTDGTTYYFVVTAVNAGGESMPSTPASATPLPAIPSPPTSVTATAGDGQITVSWSSVTGATSYNLYYSTSSSVSSTNGTQDADVTSGAVITGLIDGTTYYVVVTAVNIGGESVPSSPPVSATPVPAAPAPPTGVTAVAGDQQILVSWTASAGATAYNLYYATTSTVAPASATEVMNATNGGAITDLIDGTTYYLVVTAVNLGGESAPSSPLASATPEPPVPGAPADVVAAAGNDEITVTWTGSAGATSYDIYWSTSSSVAPGNGTKMGKVSSGAVITGLTNGTTYYLVVTAVNVAGESEPSQVVSATPAPAVPSPPADVTATAGNEEITVTWTASNGATSYNLYYSTSSTVAPGSGTEVTGATSGAVVSGLTNGTTYYVVVTAVNLGGESAPSSPVVSATPALPIPAAPTGVTATSGDQQITVAWTGSTGASGYNLYYSDSSSVAPGAATELTNVQSGVLVTGLTDGTTYYFVVTAVNASGESAPSSPAASATPVSPIPAPPSGVTATAGNQQAVVSWTGSTGATSYNIYYSTESSVGPGSATEVTGAQSGAIVTALSNGTTYYFVVTATNSAGESMPSSPAASATPEPSVPTSPGGVTVTAGVDDVTVSWTASSGATSYNIYYSTSSSVGPGNGTEVTGTSSGVQVTGLTGGTTYYFVVTAVNAGGESAASTTVSVTPLAGPTVVGTLAISGTDAEQIAVNPGTSTVYVGGTFGQQGLIAVNAANPASMTSTTLTYGGGVAVDTTTGRYATTSGYSATLYVYNSNNTLYDSIAITGCGGLLAADPATGRFFVSSQCSDHIATFSESTETLVSNIADGAVGGPVFFDSSTGNIIEDVYAEGTCTGTTCETPLIVSSSYSTSHETNANFMAVDGTRSLLYGLAYQSNGTPNLVVVDSETFETLQTYTGAGATAMAADTALGVFYVAAGNTITSFSATTYASVSSVTVGGTIKSLGMAPGDSHLYASDGSNLYAIQTQ